MRILGLLSFFSALVIAGQNANAGDYDPLANNSFAVSGANASGALDKVLAGLPSVLRNYKPKLDSSSTLLAPPEVSGSNDHPILKMAIKKCVFILCETVDFDGDVTVSEPSGRCQRNVVIDINLSHSGNTLRDVYDRFEIAVCLAQSSNTLATLQVGAKAHRSATYRAGMIQKMILDFLNLQTDPFTEVFRKALEANSI